MNSRDFFWLIAFVLIIISNSGCATKSGGPDVSRINFNSVQAAIEDTSGSKIPLKSGEIIGIQTINKISISSGKVSYVKMVVESVDTTRIKGKGDYACCDDASGGVELGGNIVEVKLEDIEYINVYKYRPYRSTGTPCDQDTACYLGTWALALLLMAAIGAAL